jgi:poly(3-hydroxybutyrate) depolymerase/CubicO group peptidase (beta-lactamase class C family)
MRKQCLGLVLAGMMALALVAMPEADFVYGGEKQTFQAEHIALAKAYHEEQKGISFIIFKQGKMVYESYANGGFARRPHELASGTKSFTGVMSAFAVQDGLMQWDELAVKTLPEWKNDPNKSTITLRQILSLNSGINGKRKAGDVPSYREALDAPALYKPGLVFMYDSAPFQIFGEVMRRKLEPLGMDPLAYLNAKLFKPLGITYRYWRRDKDGNPHLPSGAYLTARDWAKFGEFVRMEGQWEGKVLLDPLLLAECFVGSTANPGYGLTWWLNREISSAIRDKNPMIERNYFWDHPAIPKDLVRAAGAGGQRLYISQDEEWVVVRQAGGINEALEQGTEFNDEKFLSLLLTGKEGYKAEGELPLRECRLQVGDRERVFHIFAPSAYDAKKTYPLVLVFHGGGGTAEGVAWETRWSELAEKEAFLVVYPEGTRDNPEAPADFRTNGQSWNDGSGAAHLSAVRQGVDDISFVKAILAYVQAQFKVDSKRIYASGFSNGGSMSFRVGRELSGQIAAIAPVASADWLDKPLPASPLSVMYLTGTKDPLNPMEGGKLRIGWKNYGTKPPVESIFKKWKVILKCAEEAKIHRDDDKIKHFSFLADRADIGMEVYYIKEFGHYWPGGRTLMPESISGSKKNMDALDATRVIWDFFIRYPKA